MTIVRKVRWKIRHHFHDKTCIQDLHEDSFNSPTKLSCKSKGEFLSIWWFLQSLRALLFWELLAEGIDRLFRTTFRWGLKCVEHAKTLVVEEYENHFSENMIKIDLWIGRKHTSPSPYRKNGFGGNQKRYEACAPILHLCNWICITLVVQPTKLNNLNSVGTVKIKQ